MSKLFEMRQQHHAAITKAETLLNAAESAGRALSSAESLDVDTAMAEAQDLAPKIATAEKSNTLRTMFGARGPLSEPIGKGGSKAGQPKTKVLGPDYQDAFNSYLSSGGKRLDAALYEGSNSAGGFAVPITVDNQIVPLAPQEMAIRRLATVIPTTSDIKVPRQIAFATAAAKAESGATTSTFVESEPALDEFVLSAYMAGVVAKISWELAQDVPAFQGFVTADLLLAQQMYEENCYINGSGIGQAQGLIGNVGTGVTEEPDANGNLVSIDGTFDLLGSLNAEYHANASFLMNRVTSIGIRRAQRQANLFEPVWTRSNNQDYLHGYPVQYAAAMPVAAPGACPLLFGDFAAGYMVGDRGGEGISVKILDQPFAVQGQVALLVYRRTDGRVRRSEAIQSYICHA